MSSTVWGGKGIVHTQVSIFPANGNTPDQFLASVVIQRSLAWFDLNGELLQKGGNLGPPKFKKKF